MLIQNMEMSQVQEGEVTRREMFGHAIAGFGQNLIFGLWSSYMLVFYTDIFGISAGAASIIMLLTRIWDGVNDPMMGTIADHTRTKWGRYRPWLLFMAPVIVIFLVLNFSSPDLSPVAKVIYAGITYVMMSMAFTAVDVPYWTMPAAMSKDVQKRTRIISFSRMATTVATTVLGVIAVPMIQAFGKGNMEKGYMMTALVIGIVGASLYLVGFANVREHVQPVSSEKIGFKNSVRAIVQNKPLLLLLVCGLLGSTGTMLKQGMVIYYVQYCVGDFNLIPIFSVLFLPGMIIGVAIAPFFTKRFEQKTVFIVAKVIGIIIDVVFFFVGFSNITLTMILYALSSIPLGISSVVSSAMVTNTIEYAEWKFGSRQEGLISSTQTLTAKIGMALSVGVTGIVLQVSNYVPNQVQTHSTQMIIHGAFTLFCAIIGVLCVIPMFFNNFTDKRHAEIMVELEERRKKMQK